LYLENTTFRKLDLFPSSGEGKETPTLLGPVIKVSSKGPKILGVYFPSPEDGNRSSFQTLLSGPWAKSEPRYSKRKELKKSEVAGRQGCEPYALAAL
jgi:hypothetical protein